jgi:SAM-dependent methyltransferase
MSIGRLVRRCYDALPSPPSTNYYLDQMKQDPYALVPKGGLVVDVGGGSLRGAYAFANTTPTTRGLRMVSLDLAPLPGVRVVADAHGLPLANHCADLVVCVSVLEYVHDPARVVAELTRVLKPGGVLYLSTPFVFPYHGPPADRFRFSPEGLRALAPEFDEIRSGSNRGPASSFCHIFVHFLAIACCFNSCRLYGVLLSGFKWLFFWIKYLDVAIGNYKIAHVLYGNAFFLGRRR